MLPVRQHELHDEEWQILKPLLECRMGRPPKVTHREYLNAVLWKPGNVHDCSKELYKERNLVERFFNRLKHWRGLATRYEKTSESYLAMVHLICAQLWL